MLCCLAEVPVIGLRQWFPNVQSVGVTTIRHDNKPPALQQIFRTIDDWIRSAGLQLVDTARNQAFSKSHRYFVRMGGKNLSLCTVEYMPRVRRNMWSFASRAIPCGSETCWTRWMPAGNR